ncbi:3-deoxy-D-manno-octulosonic acid transferase [Orrella sp. JC864]|uniref:3-deoxy-D-manno-octulosonic acid transferase n=1 Tax=Orrella sp. JC864 TaxID=3120298 RepID=UPI0030091EE1
MPSRAVYTLALRALAPALWLWMARRARSAGGQWQILGRERFGRHDRPPFAARPVWVHAVSLGETRAAQPLLHALLARGLPVLLTHVTATGRAEGQRLFAAAIAQGQLAQAWLPYDFPEAADRFLAHFQPRCGVLVERELWPNLLAAARRRGVPMTLASARFSESSLAQARWLGAALREALGGLQAVLAQTGADARRLALAGARDPQVVGNLKFDVQLPAAQLQAGRAWRAALDRPVLAVANTREGEEAPLAQALARWLQAAGQARPLCLFVPRHPQRFEQAAQALAQAGLAVVRRSAGQLPGPQAQVLLGDTLGEMPFFYAAADVAIVAGSFAPLGGHNLIEACAAGLPVIVGPHTHNFKQAVEDAVAAGAALRADDAAQAVSQAASLLEDAARRARMGEAARAWTAQHAGATGRILAALPGLQD